MGNQRPISVCSNPNCEWPIYKGDKVWKKGSEQYCNILCLAESFENQEGNNHVKE